MKKIFYLTLMLISSITTTAQNFSCEKLVKDINIWNSFTQNNNTKWANEIKDNRLYKQNADGSFEYVYIFNCNDSLDIKTLRNISFNYISYYFHVDNATRADMETNSPDNNVYFKGKIKGLGEFIGFGEFNKINGNIIFDIRIKPNRIRFSVKIQDYHIIKTGYDGQIYENYTEYVNKCYPLNPNSNHKKSYAMAFVNANAKCLNYAKYFRDYLNKNIKQPQPTIDEDW